MARLRAVAAASTTNMLWSGLYYTNARFDVTALVTPAGSSYSWAITPGAGGIGIPFAGYLVVVYQLASDPTLTTLVFADGMDVWHANETTEAGPGPLPVLLDWTCEGNPVCNPSSVKFSRAGGNEYNVDDGDEAAGKFSDEIENYASGAAASGRGPSGQLPMCGSEPCPQVSSYSPGSPAFSNGQSQARYDMYQGSLGAKDTTWINALVLMNKCVAGTPTVSPTPSPAYSPTASPVATPTGCPPSQVAGSESTASGNASGISAPFSSPAGTSNALLLVKILADPGVNISSITYGGQLMSPAVQATGTGGTDVEIWYLVAPPTGSNTLLVNWGGSFHNYNMAVETFGGVNQASPIGANASNSNSSCPTSFSSTLTTLSHAIA